MKSRHTSRFDETRVSRLSRLHSLQPHQLSTLRFTTRIYLSNLSRVSLDDADLELLLTDQVVHLQVAKIGFDLKMSALLTVHELFERIRNKGTDYQYLSRADAIWG